MKKAFRILAGAAALASGVAARGAQVYVEGQLTKDGAGTPLTFTGGTTATGELWKNGERYASGTATLTTDDKGYFGATFHYSEVYKGAKSELRVTAGGNPAYEVTPRMELPVAPYAMMAKRADRMSEGAGDAVGLGTVSVEQVEEIGKLTGSGATLNVRGKLELKTLPSNVKDLYVKDLTIGEGARANMLTGKTGGNSMRYNSFSGTEKELYCEKDQTRDMDAYAARDGFVLITARSDDSGGSPSFYLTVKVGDFTIANDKRLVINQDEGKEVEAPLMVCPVREGERVYVKGRCSKSGLYWRKGFAKLKFIYFGN